MKGSTKFIWALCPDQVRSLETMAERAPSRRVGMRAHSILLSARGSSIDEMARIYQVHRDTVSSWLDRFGPFGEDGLRDQPRSGSPSKLNAQEKKGPKRSSKPTPMRPK
tara:strand:- start:70 stop:396 length:327 start_codon:yes stop_codon:yes gene_type:complete